MPARGQALSLGSAPESAEPSRCGAVDHGGRGISAFGAAVFRRQGTLRRNDDAGSPDSSTSGHCGDEAVGAPQPTRAARVYGQPQGGGGRKRLVSKLGALLSVLAAAAAAVALSGADDSSAAQSGGKIAYANLKSEADIRGVSADGRRRRLLVPFDGDLSYPTWSPDGRRLAYIGLQHALFVTTPRRGRTKRLAPGDAFCPDWAPRGELISFLREAPSPVVLPTQTFSW